MSNSPYCNNLMATQKLRGSIEKSTELPEGIVQGNLLDIGSIVYFGVFLPAVMLTKE